MEIGDCVFLIDDIVSSSRDDLSGSLLGCRGDMVVITDLDIDFDVGTPLNFVVRRYGDLKNTWVTSSNMLSANKPVSGH